MYLNPQRVFHFAVNKRVPYEACQKQHVLPVPYLVLVYSSPAEFVARTDQDLFVSFDRSCP